MHMKDPQGFSRVLLTVYTGTGYEAGR